MCRPRHVPTTRTGPGVHTERCVFTQGWAPIGLAETGACTLRASVCTLSLCASLHLPPASHHGVHSWVDLHTCWHREGGSALGVHSPCAPARTRTCTYLCKNVGPCAPTCQRDNHDRSRLCTICARCCEPWGIYSRGLEMTL